MYFLMATLVAQVAFSCKKNSTDYSSSVSTEECEVLSSSSVKLKGFLHLRETDLEKVSDVHFQISEESTIPYNAAIDINAKIDINGTRDGKYFFGEASGLKTPTRYYYRAVATIDWKEYYGSIKSFTTDWEAIDMGIVVGGKKIKWAPCNIGAAKEDKYGDSFAWGEEEPKTDYSWSTYTYGKSPSGPFSKYNTVSSYGTVDNNTVLDPEDDVAHVKWGGKWRMPTDAEWTALREQCTWTEITRNGVNGRLVIAHNGNSIFLPAAGYGSGTKIGKYAGSNGYYWSSSLNSSDPFDAYGVIFDSGGVQRFSYSRYFGLSVRPVWEE